MKKGTKLTLQDLMARKEQRARDSIEYKRVHVESLGGDLELKKIPLLKYLDLIGGMDENTSAGDALRSQIELIYECCPLLHNKELQEAYECVEPTDIVSKIFDDNFREIMMVGATISEFYGIDASEVMTELKNA